MVPGNSTNKYVKVEDYTMAFLTCYTRKPDKALYYDPKLAYSMHLAISEDASKWTPLNHNSGVLFARATENEDGSLHAKSLKHPFIFQAKDNRYGVVAVRTEGAGEKDESS